MRISRLFRTRAVFVVAAMSAGAASGAAGCKSEPAKPTATTPAPSTSLEAGPSAIDDATAFLELYGMTHDRKLAAAGASLRLYSWTTAEQAEEIRLKKTLLLRSESPERGASHYDHVMHDAATAGDAVAALLRTAPFLKARFAWTSAFGTRMGWPGETYGDVLLSIVVRPGAYIAKRDPTAGTWEVVTLDGTAIALGELVAHPERLAAVYFESDGAAGAPRYREFVICNESQVESFSFGTASELAELDGEIEGIEKTAAATRERPAIAGSAPPDQLAAAWHDPLTTAPVDAAGKMRRVYLANVAFDNDLYVLDAAKLDAIAASLKSARAAQPAGTNVVGAAPFAGNGAVAPPPTTKPTLRGTYYGSYMPRRKGTAPH
ncbi:hypothetical protein BH09MYX1_BH09MYX1_59300 [soil metagenome]